MKKNIAKYSILSFDVYLAVIVDPALLVMKCNKGTFAFYAVVIYLLLYFMY